MVGHMISAIITKIQMVYLDDPLMILLDHKCDNNKKEWYIISLCFIYGRSHDYTKAIFKLS